MGRPRIWLSNWGSHRTPGQHGPGRKVSVMALPREWETGEGVCSVVTPDPVLLREVKAGKMAVRAYLVAYEARIAHRASLLAPGILAFTSTRLLQEVLVEDGDSILCACSRPEVPSGLTPGLFSSPAKAW